MERKLPDGWTWKKLGDIVSRIEAGPSRKLNLNGKGLVDITSGEIGDSIFLLDTIPKYIDVSEDLSRFVLDENDILLNYVNSLEKIGKSAVYRGEHKPAVTGHNLFRIKTDPSFVNAFFLVSVFKTPYFMNQIRTITKPAVNQASFNITDLRECIIPVPPLDTQRKIVAILEKAEETKRLRAQANELTQKLLQSVFLEIIGNPIVNPKEWNIVKLSDEIEIFHGFAFQSRFFTKTDNNLVVLAPGNFNQKGGLCFEERNTRYYLGPYNQKDVLTNGDLLVVMTDLSPKMLILGRVVELYDNRTILHNQRIGKIIIKNPRRLNQDFLVFMMNQEFIRKQIMESATGALIKHTSPKRIMEVRIPLPPLEVQENFSWVYRQLIAQQGLQNNLLESISILSNNLIEKAFTGELVA